MKALARWLPLAALATAGCSPDDNAVADEASPPAEQRVALSEYADSGAAQLVSAPVGGHVTFALQGAEGTRCGEWKLAGIAPTGMAKRIDEHLISFRRNDADTGSGYENDFTLAVTAPGRAVATFTREHCEREVRVSAAIVTAATGGQHGHGS